jgi:hypothetical protein
MSAEMRLTSPRVQAIAAADDPYKKYWLAILFGFGLTGVWLCLPIMETPVGSGHVDPAKATDSSVEQSLDSVNNPAGAVGAPLNLSDAEKKRQAQAADEAKSMLYQAAPEGGPVAPGAPIDGASAGAAPASSLAQSLKDAGKTSAGGWGGEKAQRGFDSPHLEGSLSGAGKAGGGFSASASVGAFGTHNAEVSIGAAKGLDAGGGNFSSGGGAAASLRNTATAAQMAAGIRSGDAARAGLANAFDGSKGGGKGVLGGGGSGNANSAAGGLYAALDSAPANLKGNDPKIDAKKITTPDPVAAPASDSTAQMNQQLGMMVASAIIGGMIPGVGAQMAMMMMQVVVSQQNARTAAVSAAGATANANISKGLTPH